VGVKVITDPLELQDWITEQQEAMQFVSEVADELQLRCCLVWSRRVSIYFAADGTVKRVKEATPTEPVEPREDEP
jgi:hypothetical protein